jgi:hypothetical protein
MPDSFTDTSSAFEGTDLETEGYETFYSEDSEHSNVIDTTDTQDSEGLTTTGQAMSSHMVTTLTGSTFKGMVYGYDNKVFGMPYKYTTLADPLARVYQSTFESDNTCIAFIKFGTPNINRLLYQKMSADTTDAENSSFGIGSSIMLGLRSAVDPEHKATDQNLISFHEDMSEFMKYASSSLSQVYTLLDLPGYFSADDSWDVFNDNGFAFYCVKTGSFQEGVSNTYTEPSIISSMNGKAAEMRENYQLYGTYGNVNTGGSATSWLNNIATGLVENITNAIASLPIVGSVASVFMTTNKGSMSYYGKIWSDSKSDRSISMSFKFRTPYGNKYDIFRNVLFPFLLLHTASIPKQDGRYSYQEPFMIQVDFPGWFRVNCGVITNLSWVKGGDNQLWNSDGLPLELSVTMAIEDLYPIELSSKNMTVIAYNYGLLSFLENLAGLTTSECSSFLGDEAMGIYIKQNLAKYGGTIGGTIHSYMNAAFRRFTGSSFMGF